MWQQIANYSLSMMSAGSGDYRAEEEEEEEEEEQEDNHSHHEQQHPASSASLSSVSLPVDSVDEAVAVLCAEQPDGDEEPTGDIVHLMTDEQTKALDCLLMGGKKEQHEAYQLAQTYRNELYIHDAALLWRLGYACFLQSCNSTLPEREVKQLLQSADNYLQEALQLSPQCAQAFKWLAVVTGRLGELLDTKTRIQNGYKFKTLVDQALELDDSDGFTFYLKGRWCYEVATLPLWQRSIASALFATLPSSTIMEAKDSLLMAEKLCEGKNRTNRLYLAKCEIADYNYDAAAKWLKCALDMELTDTEEDETAKKAVEELWRLYNGYYCES